MSQALDWRQLKKELFNAPPEPRRNNATFKHTDIFSQSCCQSPTRVRTNDTNISAIFSNSGIKNEPLTNRGKKTFQNQQDHFGQINIPFQTKQQSKHKIPDHSANFFYNQDTERQPLSGRNKKEEEFIPKIQYKSPKLRKQEELFNTSIQAGYCLKKHDLEATVKPVQNLSKSQIISPPLQSTNLDKRIMQNESNIFHQDTLQNHYAPINRIKTKENGQREIEHIKHVNHNFSSVMGHELGVKGAVHVNQHSIGTKTNFLEVDTTRDQKALQISNPLYAQRTRDHDLKSTLDKHNYESNKKETQFLHSATEISKYGIITRQKVPAQAKQDLKNSINKKTK